MEILELTKRNTWSFKNSINGLSSRMEGLERISEMKARKWKFPSVNYRKKVVKKKKKVLISTCKTVTKRRERVHGWKSAQRSNGWNFQILAKSIYLQIQEFEHNCRFLIRNHEGQKEITQHIYYIKIYNMWYIPIITLT